MREFWGVFVLEAFVSDGPLVVDVEGEGYQETLDFEDGDRVLPFLSTSVVLVPSLNWQVLFERRFSRLEMKELNAWSHNPSRKPAMLYI